MFSKYGEVRDISLPRDRASGRPRGFAFVRYGEQSEADAAVAAEQGNNILGRPVTLEIAKYGKDDRPPPSGPPRDRGGYDGPRGGYDAPRGGYDGPRGGYDRYGPPPSSYDRGYDRGGYAPPPAYGGYDRYGPPPPAPYGYPPAPYGRGPPPRDDGPRGGYDRERPRSRSRERDYRRRDDAPPA